MTYIIMPIAIGENTFVALDLNTNTMIKNTFLFRMKPLKIT